MTHALKFMLAFAVVGTSAGAAPTITTVVSAGSFRKVAVASGAFASVFGSGLADKAYSASTPWPNVLGAVNVSVCDTQGKNCVSPQLTYVNATQINLLMPAIPNLPSSGGMTETLYVTVGSVKSNALTFQIKAYSPDIFFVDYDCLIDTSIPYRYPNCGLTSTEAPVQSPAGPYQAYRGALTDQSGNLIYSGNPAKLGQYYTLWLTGLRFDVSKQPSPRLDMEVLNIPFYDQYLRKFLNPSDIFIDASFTGPSPQFPGLSQINFQLPPSAGGDPWPCGNYNLEFELGAEQDSEQSLLIDIAVQVRVGDVPCQ